MSATELAERLIIIVAVLYLAGLIGYEYGRIMFDKPEAQCIAPSIRKPTLPAHGKPTAQWGRYLAARGRDEYASP